VFLFVPGYKVAQSYNYQLICINTFSMK